MKNILRTSYFRLFLAFLFLDTETIFIVKCFLKLSGLKISNFRQKCPKIGDFPPENRLHHI